VNCELRQVNLHQEKALLPPGPYNVSNQPAELPVVTTAPLQGSSNNSTPSIQHPEIVFPPGQHVRPGQKPVGGLVIVIVLTDGPHWRQDPHGMSY